MCKEFRMTHPPCSLPFPNKFLYNQQQEWDPNVEDEFKNYLKEKKSEYC